MALKNLFDMVKADRYTADGREAIIKAQEAETEDKVYQIGEISQKTGLQKTANGWVKPPRNKEIQNAGKHSESVKAAQKAKKEEARRQQRAEGEANARAFQEKVDKGEIKPAAGSKPSRADKEAAISKELGLTEGSLDKYSDEQIEKMYAKTQQTPEQQKADFDKSKIGQAVNKGRQEFAAEKTRQKELASKTNAIGLPKENKSEEKKTNRNEEGRRNFRAALEDNPTSGYDFAKTVEFAAPMSQEDKVELKKLRLFMSDEGADYKQALRSRASNLVDRNKSNGDWFPEKEKSIMKIAKAVGYDKELHKFIEEEYKGYDLGYSEDSAPRVLTGDTRIRVRKA